MTWEEWLSSRETKKAVLRKYGLDRPSRRKISFNPAERAMRRFFGGGRIPAWVREKEES